LSRDARTACVATYPKVRHGRGDLCVRFVRQTELVLLSALPLTHNFRRSPADEVPQGRLGVVQDASPGYTGTPDQSPVGTPDPLNHGTQSHNPSFGYNTTRGYIEEIPYRLWSRSSVKTLVPDVALAAIGNSRMTGCIYWHLLFIRTTGLAIRRDLRSTAVG
jgi:hypothetical protein